MRTLARNEREFYYANPIGVEQVTDARGFRTGEKRIVYGEPVKCKGNISPATGSVSIEQFGSVEAYDKVIVMCEPDLPVTMNSVFWVDDQNINETYTNYDYIIGHISRSLNSISIAIKAVDV